MQRFYFDIELESKLKIDEEGFFKQISFVLRSRIGDEIILFNSDPFDYIYKIISISKKGIELELVSKIPKNTDPSLEITLYQAIPNKYEKIDYILQKGVEVGIRNFVFFKSERYSKLVINENKIARFEAIIKESLEQCGGNIMPKLVFKEKLDLSEINGKTLVCSTKIITNKNGFSQFYPPDKGELKGVKKSEFEINQDGNNLPTPLVRGAGKENFKSIDFTDSCHSHESGNPENTRHSEFISESIDTEINSIGQNKINIFIGPEGGFGDSELDSFEKNNFEFVNFGTRILRTETMSSVLSFMILNGYK